VCFNREQGRDISEKIALGLAKPTMSKESMFDSRLFNQSEGISSGFRGGDDEGMSPRNLLSLPGS
jgi:SNW domain-containing protein 1